MDTTSTLGQTANTHECIEWDGALSWNGYGLKNHKRVHRLVWEEEKGPIPPGMCVLHRCDNRPCINIDHLFLGTRADNLRDMALKGRHYSRTITHCPNGHEYTPENLYPSDYKRKHRRCRICCNARSAKR